MKAPAFEFTALFLAGLFIKKKLQAVFFLIGNRFAALKSWGFRWSPSNKAWQRQLNGNAIYAAGQIDFIKPLDGRTPRELQPKPKAKGEQER